jgi:hypothetical protein
MKRVLLLIALCLAAIVVASGQQAQMPTPAPEVKKLSYFEGTWSLSGDMKPSSFGPGGKMTETERNDWMEGGFFLVCHVDFSSATMGKGTGLSLMGWDPESKMYTYDGFNSMGEHEVSKGTYQDGTWVFANTSTMGGKKMDAKFTVKEVSPTSYTFKFEMAPSGQSLNTVMEGTATKQ